MELHEIIQHRREITSFEDKDIPEDVMKALINAGTLAPAGNNLPSREFIIIREPGTLKKLSETPATVDWLENARAAVVVTGRPDVSKYWLQDSSIACAFLWLTAVNHGLGAAFGAIYHAQDQDESEKRESFVRDVLHLPENRHITAILGLGYPTAHPGPKTPSENSELVYFEMFDD